jgi:hypothetical protein
VILHNLFIKSILNNAYCSFGRPPIPPPLDKKLAVNQKKVKKEKKARQTLKGLSKPVDVSGTNYSERDPLRSYCNCTEDLHFATVYN